MADETDGEWLTWNEAADRLGIKPESVKRRARAKKWARRTGNDGLAKVRIPPTRLERAEDDRADDREAIRSDQSDAYLERAIRAEARAEAAEKITDEIRADRDEWRKMAERLSQTRPGIIARLFGFGG